MKVLIMQHFTRSKVVDVPDNLPEDEQKRLAIVANHDTEGTETELDDCEFLREAKTLAEKDMACISLGGAMLIDWFIINS